MTRKQEIEDAARLRYGNECASFIHGAQWADQKVLEIIDEILYYHDCDAYVEKTRIGMRIFANELRNRIQQ